MSKKRLCKVTAGKADYYMLSTEILDRDETDSFNLALSDGESAWSGIVTADNIEAYSDKIHMDYDDLLSQTRKALTRDKMGSFNFIYETKTTANEGLKFTWKKHVTAESIKFQLGSVDLRRSTTPSDVICQIFDHALNSVGSLQERINNLESDNERLTAERATALKRVEKLVNAKADIENDLYSKFVVVLNDKKAKLKELKQQVEAYGEGASVDPTPRYASEPGPSRSRPSGQSDDTDDAVSDREDMGSVKRQYDSEYDTDEAEKPTSAPPRKQQRAKKEAASNSRDNSLLFDDGEDEDQPVVGRRRRGKAASGKRQTPAKPVIPKVPSSETKAKPGTSKGSRRSSMKKSPSLNSTKSSENMDDLMEDFLT